MIKAITFDLDGVFFPVGKQEFMHGLEKYGVSFAEAERVFLDSPEMLKYKLGKLSDQAFWSWAIKQWHLNLTPDEVITLLVDGYAVDQDVLKTVRRLREQGYKALVCSNNFPARINGLEQRFHFIEEFDAIVLPYDVGALKPEPEMFKALISRAGVPAESIVYADDNTANVAAAKSLGISAFTYESFDQFTHMLSQLGVTL